MRHFLGVATYLSYYYYTLCFFIILKHFKYRNKI